MGVGVTSSIFDQGGGEGDIWWNDPLWGGGGGWRRGLGPSSFPSPPVVKTSIRWAGGGSQEGGGGSKVLDDTTHWRSPTTWRDSGSSFSPRFSTGRVLHDKIPRKSGLALPDPVWSGIKLKSQIPHR